MVEADLGLYDYCALVPVLTGAGGVMTDWEVRATCPNLMRDRAWCKFDLSCLGPHTTCLRRPHRCPASVAVPRVHAGTVAVPRVHAGIGRVSPNESRCFKTIPPNGSECPGYRLWVPSLV